MASKRINQTISDQWLDSAWEVWRDAEVDYKVNVGVALFRSPQRGVVKVHVFALEGPVPDEDPVEICSATRQYPSAHTMILETLLFQLVSDVSRELHYKRLAEQEAAPR